MATGSGKTVVMAMTIAWAFCNRGRNPLSSEFPDAVLVCAPNLTVKNRLAVLRPEDPANYYATFDIVPLKYREYLQRGKVLVTNWHVFGLKSPGSEGGVTYKVVDKGGTMRLGARPAVLAEGTKSAAAYGTTRISERHRHLYEFNAKYREQLEQAGLVIAGTSPDGSLVEIVEMADHPWFVAVQFHPEFKSKPTAAHPLFSGLVAAAVERHAGSAWVAEA